MVVGSSNGQPLGSLLVPELSGLTFYAPDPQPGQEKRELLMVKMDSCEYSARANAADHTGKTSYTIPLAPLAYCWE